MQDDARRYFLQPQVPRPGHRAQVLVGGAQAYPAMLEAIAAAREHILLEIYIWESDAFGRRFAEALMVRARQGVQVRAVLDAVGSSGFDGRLEAELRAAGVQLSWFHPLSPFRKRRGLTVRDHRKLLVIDGAIAFLGGMNLSDAHAPVEWGGGGWFDVHLRLEGPAAHDLCQLFAVTWRYTSGQRLALPKGAPPVAPEPSAVAQVLAIDSRASRRLIRRHYEHALKRARRQILILEGYFIPDRGLRAILRKAVGRGVEVRVLVPRRSDVALVQHASRFTYGALLRAGVQIYEWLPTMLHAKAICVDGQWLAIGSYNLDQRSLRYNWEISAAVADRSACAALEADFEAALLQAERVDRTAWSKRPAGARVVQWFAYLFRNLL